MKTRRIQAALLMAMATAIMGCATAPETAQERDVLHEQVVASINGFKDRDGGMQRFFDSSYGYAVFPAVGEGAAGIGGAFGRGELYQHGTRIGHCSVSQATLGAQLGGQSYSEIVFFQDKATLDSFKANEVAFDAKASAIAASSGASASADYKKGVLVFSDSQGGLMFQAAIGGQKFNYVSDSQTPRAVAEEQ